MAAEQEAAEFAAELEAELGSPLPTQELAQKQELAQEPPSGEGRCW